jgi:mycothiol system anti-sigma-R factor
MSAECDGVLDRVYAYIDGEVPEDDVESIRRHLDECAPCLEEYQVEAALKALVRRSCTERAPEQLRRRIHAAILQVRERDDAGTTTTTTTTTVVTSVTTDR